MNKLQSDRGAVTIYTILIIVPLFLFQAVLIDFVRVKVAPLEAEQAIKAASRSVLSSYDKQLLSYGIFGLKANKDEQLTIANQVISKHGTSKRGNETFRWLILKPDSEKTIINNLYTLADHRILRQQILEEMKYKAPIEFTRNVVTKLDKKSKKTSRT